MRSRATIALVVSAVLVLICAMAIRSLVEPSYEDRPLRQWVTQLGSSKSDQRAQAARAVRRMGKRAVPFLVARLGQHVPWWKVRLARLLQRQSLVRFQLAIPTMPEIDSAVQRSHVFAACDAHGPAACGALPALEEAFYKYRDFEAAYAMSRLGQKAIPALLRASTNKNYFVRISALYFLESFRQDADTLAIDPPDGDFLHRARIQEKRMLA